MIMMLLKLTTYRNINKYQYNITNYILICITLVYMYLLLHRAIRWILGIIFYVGTEINSQIEFLF